MTPFPPDGVTPGATNTGTEGRDTWEAIEALAAILEPEAFNPDQPADEGWREATKDTALVYAARVISSGYRRVVEDEDTVERVVRAILAVNPAFRSRQAAVLARAAVRALREGPSPTSMPAQSQVRGDQP